MTLDDLSAFGADVESGMRRCMDNESFYMRLVDTVRQENKYAELRAAVAAGDLDGAFEAAHSLKGVFGNLSITPLYEPMHQITELLRTREDVDYSALLDQVDPKWEEFLAL